MPPHLASVRGPLIGRTFALGDQPLTIGRAADNAVVIASPRASRHHAHIRREGAAFVIYDLGSANGTLVNGQRVQRAVLQPGDLIDIGDEVFRFEAGHQQDATLLSAPQAQPPAYPSQPPTAPAYPPQTPPPAYSPPPAPSAYPPQAQQPAYSPPQAPPAYPPQAHPPSTRRRQRLPPTRRRRNRLPTRRRRNLRHHHCLLRHRCVLRRRPIHPRAQRHRIPSRPRRRGIQGMVHPPVTLLCMRRRPPGRKAADAPACWWSSSCWRWSVWQARRAPPSFATACATFRGSATCRASAAIRRASLLRRCRPAAPPSAAGRPPRSRCPTDR